MKKKDTVIAPQGKPRKITLAQIKELCKAQEEKWQILYNKKEMEYDAAVSKRNAARALAWVRAYAKPDTPQEIVQWLTERVNNNDALLFEKEKPSPNRTGKHRAEEMVRDLHLALTMDPYCDWQEVVKNIHDVYELKPLVPDETP